MLNLVCQAANCQGFIDLGAGWTLVDNKDFVEYSSEPSEREPYAFWYPYCMDGARPGYIPRGDMPGIYHISLPLGQMVGSMWLTLITIRFRRISRAHCLMHLGKYLPVTFSCGILFVPISRRRFMVLKSLRLRSFGLGRMSNMMT